MNLVFNVSSNWFSDDFDEEVAGFVEHFTLLLPLAKVGEKRLKKATFRLHFCILQKAESEKRTRKKIVK